MGMLNFAFELFCQIVGSIVMLIGIVIVSVLIGLVVYMIFAFFLGLLAPPAGEEEVALILEDLGV